MSGKVLVVEDTPANMKLVTLLLRQAGCEVLQVQDAADAIAVARTVHPDLILMDIQLPGMDGLEATRILKQDEATRRIPVVALTALAMKGDEERIIAAGCDGYIAKPIQYRNFLDKVSRLLPRADPYDRSDRHLSAVHDGHATTLERRPAPTAQEAQHEGALVLLVDDHPTNRSLLLRQLHALGYSAETAEDGVEAMVKWKTGRFDIVITDCHMMNMDGYELVRTIRGIESENGRRRVPIIACTANARDEEFQACRAAGMDDCLVKPVQLAALATMLDRWLPARPPVGQPADDSRTMQSAPSDSNSVIDVSLIATTWGADPKTVRRILAEFRRANDADADMLRRAMAVTDYSLAVRAAHRMAGASKMVGAHHFADLCERIHTAARAKDWSTVVDSAAAFEEECRRVNACIDTLTQVA